MASGRFDFNGLMELRNNLEKLQDEELEAFIDGCAKELAARLLAKVIKRTPVGQYTDGKQGGTLRKGWTAGKAAATYVQELTVHHFGGNYVIEIINPVEYASYVEFGHRTRNHTGWVEGVFMLTISEQEVQSAAPAILESKLKKRLGAVFK